jgi:CBS domain-containing protein
MPTRIIRDVIERQPILTATGDISVREATRRMVNAHVGSIMITEGDRIAGIFTERDALVRVLAKAVDPETTRVDAVMTPNPQTVEADVPLGHALHLMYEGGFRHVPVVEDGRPVGMISARDALGPELAAFEDELQQRVAIAERL